MSELAGNIILAYVIGFVGATISLKLSKRNK
jgi:hypothetical protein